MSVNNGSVEVLRSIVRYDTYTDTFDEMAELKEPR
jgi:hypothetical protein